MSRKALTRQASFFLFLHDRSAKKFSFRITSFCALLLRALSLDGAWKNKKERWKNRKNLRKVAKFDAVLRCEQANFMQIFRRRIRSATCALFNTARISFDSVFTQFQTSSGFLRRNFSVARRKRSGEEERPTMMMAGSIIFCVTFRRFLCVRRVWKTCKFNLNVTKVNFMEDDIGADAEQRTR